MKVVDETEVVVIGAGAVGCSIAYWCAKRGKAVTLVDKMGPATGTSIANFGLVWTSTAEPSTYMELNLRSSWLLDQMIEELGEDVEYRSGGLKLALNQEQYERLEAIVDRQSQSALYRGRMISAPEVREMQPGVSPEIAGALYSPDDGDSDPIKWTYALLRGCKGLGVTVLRDTEVLGVDLDDGHRVTGLRTSRGRIRARDAVNAAGVWAAEVARMVGVTIGLFPQRGQILVSEAAPMVLPVPQSTVRQSPAGNFFMGLTQEDVGFDWSTTIDGAEKIAQNAVNMVPMTRELSVIRQFAGLRPMPRDGLPFIGSIPHVPGYHVAVGHHGHALSPIHGKIISDLIVDGETDIELKDFDPLRFDERRREKRDQSGTIPR